MINLRLNNVGKVFVNGNDEHKILESIDLFIDDKEFVCIIGQSGCGKTTLLRIMAGFEKVTTGEVVCNDEKILKPKIKIAYIFQDFNQLLPWKTVRQNVMYPLLLNNYGSKKDCEMKAEEYLELIGLKECLHYYPHTLSGGMKQRVALARALAMQPELILMDEPFSSVDAQTGEKLHQELLSIWKKLNLTIVFVTHNIEEAIHLSTRVLVLGGKPAKITNDFQNNVKGTKMPTDEGFSEFWQRLHKSVKVKE